MDQSNHACSKQSLLALTSSSLTASTPSTGCGWLVGLESSWRRSTQGSATLLHHCNDRLNRRAPRNCSARHKHQWRALLESRLQKKTCHQARIAEVLYKLKSVTNELQLQMDWYSYLFKLFPTFAIQFVGIFFDSMILDIHFISSKPKKSRKWT